MFTETSKISLFSSVRNIYSLNSPHLPVIHKDLAVVVRVPGNQIRCHRVETHKPTVSTDRGLPTPVVTLLTATRDADTFNGTILSVVYEYVVVIVGVSRNQIGSIGGERDESAVGAYRSSGRKSGNIASEPFIEGSLQNRDSSPFDTRGRPSRGDLTRH